MVDQFAGPQRPTILDPFEGSFLKLREDKAPLSWTPLHSSVVKNWTTVGLRVLEPFVVLDVDSAEQAEKLTKLLTCEKIKAQIMQTSRGRHFWFRSSEPIKNTVHTMTAVGLEADYRSYGKASQVAVKLLGQWRRWLTDYAWDDLAEIPWWLRGLNQTKWKFYSMGEGSGRNQALFEYQIELANRGKTWEEAVECISLINSYILEEPLSDTELATVLREDAYPKLPVAEEAAPLDPWFVPSKTGVKFLHNVMGDFIISEKHVVVYHGKLFCFRDGYYQGAEAEILKYLIYLFPTCSNAQREEVLKYIGIQADVGEVTVDPNIINVINGRLNLTSRELAPHAPEYYDFQQVNARWEPKAESIAVSNMLDRVFVGDPLVLDLFEEMVGYCLTRDCRYQKLFVMFGDGNNGKSTLLRMLLNFFGEGNYSTLALQDLETVFRASELDNKLVNLGDDIPVTTIKDSSKLKNLSTGEAIVGERKYQPPFTLRNYAKFIFTTNKMPKVNDKSFGFFRRLVMIPLNATFSKADKNYDPDILDKITSPEAMSYLLRIGVNGLKRLRKNQGFTKPTIVERATEAYRVESSHALTWAQDNEIQREYLLSKSTRELYFEFKSWAESEGLENIPKAKTFTDELKKEFGFPAVRQKRDGSAAPQRYFVLEESA